MRRHLSIRTLILLAVLFILLFAGIVVLVGLGIYAWFIKNNIDFKGHFPFIIVMFSTAIIISTLFSIPITRFFVLPIKELSKATERVREGDFTVRVERCKTSDELLALVDGFNEMVEELGNIKLLRSDFISNFSHEFKTPINSIKGFANELMADGNLSEFEKREYLQIIVDESTRLADMAANVLLLTDLEHTSSIEGGKLFSLDEQIRRCILILENQWSEKDLELDIELDEVDYFCDEDILSHLWLNLLSNAIKYSPHGEKLTIRCGIRGDKVKVTFADRGEGISSQQISRIFDRFYQADTSHKSEGHGLGLALCKRIAELCGGGISVRSELGKGSTFAVELPIKKKQ